MSVNNMIYFCALVFAILCVVFPRCSGEDAPFYKFVMKDINGVDVNFGQYKGKVNI